MTKSHNITDSVWL